MIDQFDRSHHNDAHMFSDTRAIIFKVRTWVDGSWEEDEEFYNLFEAIDYQDFLTLKGVRSEIVEM